MHRKTPLFSHPWWIRIPSVPPLEGSLGNSPRAGLVGPMATVQVCAGLVGWIEGAPSPGLFQSRRRAGQTKQGKAAASDRFIKYSLERKRRENGTRGKHPWSSIAVTTHSVRHASSNPLDGGKGQ